MPKFKNEQARQKYMMALAGVREWRLGVLSELTWDVLSNGYGPMTWARVASTVPKHYRENEEDIRKGDPMFETHKDGFISRKGVLARKSHIRRTLAGEGNYIALARINGKIIGICATRDSEAVTEMLDFQRHIIDASAESHNLVAEEANRHIGTEIPHIAVALLLPGFSETSP